MLAIDMVSMKNRPPHKLDVMANAVYGDQIPNLFREGKYYEQSNLVYTYDTTTGDIDVWECNKSGVYTRPAEPSWSQWSMNDIRTRLGELEELIKEQLDVYDTQDYQHSYYLHDIGVRDWNSRGDYVEVYNNSKYLAKKHYTINEEEVVAVDGETLPTEYNTTVYLSKSANSLTNLVRRVEMYGTLDSEGRILIPYPFDDMSVLSSYIFDLYIDGVYISQNFISIEKDSNGNKCAVVSFDNMDISQELKYLIEDGDLSIIYPIDQITTDSEFVFVFYVSISHDLTLQKTDYDTFIGYSKNSKWVDITSLGYTNQYQELSVFNNGIRMRPELYTISKNRVSIDNPDNRFVVGSVATMSMKTFVPIDEDVVPNVKEETVPMINDNKLIPIPFLNYDEDTDHFLVFNDGGILLGNQKWFEDNGYINVYDDDIGLESDDMVEFRMISRDQNMEVRTYTLTTTEDNQATYELPMRLRDIYFHMLFTENGQYISRSKYALSGKLLQFRTEYATMLKGERFELICFNYIGKYGFTKMTTYKSLWNSNYAEQVPNTLQLAVDEANTPTVEPEPEPEGPQYEEGAFDNLVTNEDGTTLKYDPGVEPGTAVTEICNMATINLTPAVREDTGKQITTSHVSYVLGVDADNQIICSMDDGTICRFDRDHVEDTRYNLKQLSNGTISMLESDDFGNIYFKPFKSTTGTGGDVDIVKVDSNGNKCWSMYETNHGTKDYEDVAAIKSMKYHNGYLYVSYTPHSITEYTVGKIDTNTGKFYYIDTTTPLAQGSSARHMNKYSSRYSNSTGYVYIGSEGHTIYEYDTDGNLNKSFSDGNSSVDRDGYVTEVYCTGKYVYGIVKTGDMSRTIIKYDYSDGSVVYTKQYSCPITIAFDVDGCIYVFEELYFTIAKLEETYSVDDTGEFVVKEIWTHTLSSAVSSLNNLFVDPVDYHIYAYYVNNNESDRLWYADLEQIGLPLPKYTHSTMFNGSQNVTTTDLIGSSLREINYRSASTNRLYIGTKDGSIYTYTQRMKEMSKKITVGLWRDDNPDNPVYIIPDNNYNFYVIKENIIEKWNRYERLQWRYDAYKIMTSVLDKIVLNPETNDLVFLYGDTNGRYSLGRLSEDGDFEQLDITLPNGVKVEDSGCSISCDSNGNYLFGYSGSTIYIYTKNFTPGAKNCYGIDTDIMLDGPVGNVVVSHGNMYVSVKNDNDGSEITKYSKLIKYSSTGTVAWEQDFMGSATYANLFIDANDNVYVTDDKEIRKLDENGNYVWRFKYSKEDIGAEPKYILMDEFYRLFLVDTDYSLHRIDQYDLTLNPIPDEYPEPLEPTTSTGDTGSTGPELGYMYVQSRFDLPFEFDKSTSSMLIFSNTGEYIGNRFYDIYNDQIRLKGSPIYENGWLDIVLIENVKESIVL